MTLAIILAVMWFLTFGYAMAIRWDHKVLENAFDEVKAELERKPKQIEVVNKSMCECGHESSKHTDREGCREVLFRTVDGVETSKSFYCRCARYTGPEPLPAYYAPDLPDYKELN